MLGLRRLRSAGLVGWVTVAVVFFVAEVAGGGVPVDLPRHALVFATHADSARSDYDLATVCGDGTQWATIVRGPGHQYQVAVSPDGSQIVYSSPVEGESDLWRRSIDGGEAVNLTAHPAKDGSPAWSPDGAQIAFTSNRDAEKPEVYLLTLADGRTERVTENAFYEGTPDWSPDGRSLIFTRYFPAADGAGHGGDGEIIRLDIETGDEEQLTRLGGYNGDASYSPDGGSIVFHRTSDDGSELWRLDLDGSAPRPLTATTIDEYTPRWSPDGSWIAYTAGQGGVQAGRFDLWLIRPDGSGARVLSAAPESQGWHRWRGGEHRCR